MRRCLIHTLRFFWALSLVLLASPVRAQELSSAPTTQDQTARANELFHTAKQQQAQGHLAAACATFEQSYQLAPRGGTLINLALCHRDLGELVVARQELLKARAVAQRDGRSDREAIANEHLSALERELSWVDVADPTEIAAGSAKISIDGQAVASEVGGVAIALMPGEHRIHIEAEGYAPVELQITLFAGARTRVPPQPLQRLTLAPVVPEAPPAAPLAATALPPAAAAHDGYSPWRTTGLVVAIAGIAAGLTAGAWALERKSAMRQFCDPARHECTDQAGIDAAATGKVLALVSTLACGVGVAGVGVWLFLPGGVLNERAPAALSSAGITWHGRF